MKRTALATVVTALCCYFSLGTSVGLESRTERVSATQRIEFADSETERTVSVRVATTGELESVVVALNSSDASLRLENGGMPSSQGLGACGQLRHCEHTLFVERGTRSGAFSVVLTADVVASITDDGDRTERELQNIDVHVDLID